MPQKGVTHILLFLALHCFVNLYTQTQTDLKQFKSKLESYNKLEQYDSLVAATSDITSIKINNETDSLIGSQIFHLLANAHYSKTAYFKAITYYDRSIDLAPESAFGNNQKGISLFDKAFAEYELQNHYESYQTVKKAEAILSSLEQPNHDYLLSIYADLGSEASKLGFYEDAEFYLNKGIALYEANKSKLTYESDQSASKPVLFEYKFIYLYYAKQDEKLLLKHLKSLEHLSKTRVFNTTETLMLAVAYNYIGDYYLNRFGKEQTPVKSLLTKGKYYLDLSLDLLDKDSQKGNYAQVVFNIAKYYRHLKQFDKAKLTNNLLYEIVGANDYRMPFFIAQKVMIAIDQGLKDEALGHLKTMINHIHSGNQALKDDFSNFSPSSIIQHTGLLVEITDAFLKNFPEDTALQEQISRCYDLGLIQLSHSYQGEWYSNFLDDYYKNTLKGILKSMEQGLSSLNAASLIESIEHIENKYQWNSFRQSRTLNNTLMSDAIFDKELYYRREIVAAKSKNDSILINELNHKLNNHLRQLKALYPNIYKYIYSEFDIQDFQKSLDPNTVIFRYKVIDDFLYIFKITPTEVVVKSTFFSESIKTQIKTYISLIQSKQEQKDLAKNITKTLLPFPLQDVENITIVPDGILHNIPFETLVDKENRYLIESYNLSYSSHLIFTTNNHRDVNLDTVVVFAPQYSTHDDSTPALKGAQKEAIEISDIFSERIFPKLLSSKSEFIENAHKADLIHLAMHAKIDNAQPNLSYFSFHQNGHDERLYLEELYALKLKANLAVLSACNTGFGITNNGKGSVSLQRAFVMAGVPATVSSLWNAPDDATQQIMTNFYRLLKQGEPKHKALRNAKLNYIQSKEDKDITTPFYWAGFVLSGDYSAISTIETENDYTFILFSILALALVLVLFKLAKKF